jgi:hypothetical protein
MNYNFYHLFFILFFLCNLRTGVCQIKSFETTPVVNNIKIDGAISENSWNLKEYDFIQTIPDNGALSSNKVVFSIVYDESYLYVAARIKVKDKNQINNTITFRDALNNTDYFGVTLDPFGLASEGYSFIITPAGVQYDSKYGGDGSEYTEWNAVWSSATKIDDSGWQLELRIPFNFLRFDKKNLSNFKFNLVHFNTLTNEQSWWSPIDAEKPGFLNQFGNLKGLKDIAPPINLTFLPFGNVLIDKDNIEDETTVDFTGGMDIKYVYKNSFAIDASIIPDFSQTTFDNQILNLTAFEVQFDENRQFFTEGTELFNKSNFFYSRRIGESPFLPAPFFEDDELIEYPTVTQILNLVKFTAKNRKGFGISMLNGFVNREFAEYKSGRKVLINPYSNYNSIVMEQVLKNNSFIYFANSSVIREGNNADFNLSEVRYQQFTNGQKFRFDGDFSLSQNYNPLDTSLGYFYKVSARKASGSFLGGLTYEVYDEKFDPSDFGFLVRNNLRSYNAFTSYTKFNPFWKFNRFSASFTGTQNYYKSLNIRESTSMQMNLQPTMKNNDLFNIGANIRLKGRDFFEPRIQDRFANVSSSIEPYVEFISNTNKNFYFQLYGFYKHYYSKPYDYELRFGHQINKIFGTKLTVNLNQDLRFLKSNVGVFFINGSQVNTDNTINYTQRDVINLTSNLNSSYLISNRMGLSLKLRHFWAYVENKELYFVDNKGAFRKNPEPFNFTNSQINFNLFNLDFLFRWQFAAGSELSFNWQKSINVSNNELETNFLNNIRSTFDNKGIDTFSFKIVYFLDYNTIKKVYAN